VKRSASLGASFSHRNARHLGLDPARAFEQVLGVGFGLLRVSAYWDELEGGQWGPLERLLEAAERAGQPLVVTVGMKGIRWPEFYVPPALATRAMNGLRGPLLEFVAATVEHFRGSPAVAAWQVENEPLNRSGPRRRWIPVDLLAAEVAAVRSLDTRPLVLTAFRHFNHLVDLVARPWPWTPVERRLLGLLNGGDALGLDVYTRIGWELGRRRRTSGARASWPEEAQAAAGRARTAGRQAWITELQAEPWGAGSFSQADLAAVHRGLAGRGFDRVLLWGAEHWLWRESQGDASWLRQVEALVEVASS
jgi:hypothetical protein